MLPVDGETVNPMMPITAYAPGMGEYLKAKFGDAFWNNPSIAAARLLDEGTAVVPDAFGGMVEDMSNPSVALTREEAIARVQAAKVPIVVPEGGITDRALSTLIENKQDEIRRQTIIASSPTGARSVAGFGVAMAANLLDPLNIGAAFVPVVGEARYTAMLAEAGGAFGRAGVRFGVGALQGGITQAAIEPLILAANQKDQADYHMVDSLLNVAFGTLLGGGLHSVAGAVGERLRGATPEQRTAALRTAVGQAEDGRVVNVEPILAGGDLRTAAQRQADVEAIGTADPHAARAADETVRTAPTADETAAAAEATLRTDRLKAAIDDIEARGGNVKALREQAAKLDNTEEAASLERAVRAAAACGVR